MSAFGKDLVTDKLIAQDAAIAASGSIASLSAMVATTACPDLKRLFQSYLEQSITSQTTINTYIVDRGWAKPFISPEDQLRMAIEDADSLIAMKL
jgi:spore coat protein CotF